MTQIRDAARSAALLSLMALVLSACLSHNPFRPNPDDPGEDGRDDDDSPAIALQVDRSGALPG